MWAALKALIKFFTQIFIVIDGLDEFDTNEREPFVEKLQRLQSDAGVPLKLLVTTRNIYDMSDLFQSDVVMEIRAVEQDIRGYMEHRIQGSGLEALIKSHCQRMQAMTTTGTSHNSGDELKLNIMDRIAAKADGM